MVVTAVKVLYTCLFLVLTFFLCQAYGCYCMRILALVLVLVYVGAVMTLFLFVVMMLNSDSIVSLRNSFVRYLRLAHLSFCWY